MLPESPGRREEGFNKSSMRNKIATYRSKAVLKDRKFYFEIETRRMENGCWILASELNCWVIHAFENAWHDLAPDPGVFASVNDVPSSTSSAIWALAIR